MTFTEELRRTLAKEDIPSFLSDLQALVQALREDRPWQHLLTPRLRDHPALVLAYLQPGAKRDAVAQELD